MLVSTDPASIGLLLAATFVGGVANLVVIVGFMVTATSGLTETEQGLATGLATMSQQIGITMGIPIMSALFTAQLVSRGTNDAPAVLSGVTVAIGANAGLCLLTALVVALFSRKPGPAANCLFPPLARAVGKRHDRYKQSCLFSVPAGLRGTPISGTKRNQGLWVADGPAGRLRGVGAGCWQTGLSAAVVSGRCPRAG